MSKLLNTGIVVGYLYVVMVVTYYGFDSYFNIPPNYIDYSPQGLIVFCFDMTRLALAVLHNSSGWSLFVLGLSIGIVAFVLWFIFIFNWIGRWFVTALTLLVAVLLVFGFFNLGSLLASTDTEFYTTPSKCIPGATESLYIAPVLNDTESIFVPVDPTTHKLINGLLVRDTASLTCQLTEQYIGAVSK